MNVWYICVLILFAIELEVNMPMFFVKCASFLIYYNNIMNDMNDFFFLTNCIIYGPMAAVHIFLIHTIDLQCSASYKTMNFIFMDQTCKMYDRNQLSK